MSKTETRWWWIRHAPVIGSEGRFYGQTDLHADCSDAATFQALARVLPADAVLISSDMNRTTQTAAAIVEAGLGLPDAILDAALREQHLGDLQGRRRDDYAAERGRDLQRTWIAPAHERIPNGESFADLVERTVAAIQRYTADHAGRDIVCVAHGGTIRAAMSLALGLNPTTSDLERVFAFAVQNCSVTQLRHALVDAGDAYWRIGKVNWLPD